MDLRGHVRSDARRNSSSAGAQSVLGRVSDLYCFVGLCGLVDDGSHVSFRSVRPASGWHGYGFQRIRCGYGGNGGDIGGRLYRGQVLVHAGVSFCFVPAGASHHECAGIDPPEPSRGSIGYYAFLLSAAGGVDETGLLLVNFWSMLSRDAKKTSTAYPTRNAIASGGMEAPCPMAKLLNRPTTAPPMAAIRNRGASATDGVYVRVEICC